MDMAEGNFTADAFPSFHKHLRFLSWPSHNFVFIPEVYNKYATGNHFPFHNFQLGMENTPHWLSPKEGGRRIGLDLLVELLKAIDKVSLPLLPRILQKSGCSSDSEWL